ncbi:hypothetical protein Tco_1078665 [Tanacetum coccineum]|uniref:Uncharacterized protein n=1 Tax=Tanacetum coccineum TaxID=301880 RepID=A0ABQ5HR97_9ASTR
MERCINTLNVAGLALGRHLEEIHVIWALFWKKQDKSTTLHKRRLEELLKEGGDGVRITCDAVWIIKRSLQKICDDIWTNANPSSPTHSNEFLGLEKKLEVESWLENSRSVDSLVSSHNELEDEIEGVEEQVEEEDDLEYFDIFPTMEELGYHEWLLKNPRPSWDTTSVIDHYLGSVVFGKAFVEKTELIYDKEEGTVLFEKNNEKIIFKIDVSRDY